MMVTEIAMDAQALYNQGMACFREDAFEQAAGCFEQAVEENSQHADALEALGVTYGKLDRLEDAIRVMKQLTVVDPAGPMAHTNLSLFYVKLGLKDEAEAEKSLAMVLGFRQEAGAAKETDEERQVREARTTEAAAANRRQRIQQFQEALREDPDDPVMQLTVGKLLFEDEQFQDAEQAFRIVLTLQENYSVAYEQLGKTLEALGQTKDAIEVYQQGVEVAEAQGDLMPAKGMCYRLDRLAGD